MANKEDISDWSEPLMWDDEFPDYSDETYIIKTPRYEWQWSLGDVINSLIKAGLSIEFINEFDKIFYKAFSNMKQDKNGWWHLPRHRNKVPLMFTLRAKKDEDKRWVSKTFR